MRPYAAAGWSIPSIAGKRIEPGREENGYAVFLEESLHNSSYKMEGGRPAAEKERKIPER